MKKLIVIAITLFFAMPVMAWDIGTYPEGQEMQANVFHYFVDYAITVDTSADSQDTSERIKYAIDIIRGHANRNIMSVACATNASIRAKIIESDISYVSDLEYVIATEYESGQGVPLFTILADKIYNADAD